MPKYREYKLVEATTESTHYYYIPQHDTFIPKCSNSQRVLLTLLCVAKDIHSPVHVSEYPILPREHVRLFPSPQIRTVRVHYRKYIDVADIQALERKKEQAKLNDLLRDNNIDIDTL